MSRHVNTLGTSVCQCACTYVSSIRLYELQWVNLSQSNDSRTHGEVCPMCRNILILDVDLLIISTTITGMCILDICLIFSNKDVQCLCVVNTLLSDLITAGRDGSLLIG